MLLREKRCRNKETQKYVRQYLNLSETVIKEKMHSRSSLGTRGTWQADIDDEDVIDAPGREVEWRDEMHHLNIYVN